MELFSLKDKVVFRGEEHTVTGVIYNPQLNRNYYMLNGVKEIVSDRSLSLPEFKYKGEQDGKEAKKYNI